MMEKLSASEFDANYAYVLNKLDNALSVLNKSRKDVILLAATKTVDAETINYAITKYGLMIAESTLSSAFTNSKISDVLAIVQFSFNIIMCVLALKYFESFVIEEHEEQEKNTKKMITARNIYTTDCVGIDTLEDDYLL